MPLVRTTSWRFHPFGNGFGIGGPALDSYGFIFKMDFCLLIKHVLLTVVRLCHWWRLLASGGPGC